MGMFVSLPYRVFTFLLIACFPSLAHAEFALNFSPVATENRVDSLVNIDCSFQPNDSCLRNDKDSDPDQSRFFQEIAQGDNGAQYYHVIVGAEEEGFALEYFIEITGSGDWANSGSTPYNYSSGALYNGGEDAFPGLGGAVDPLSTSDPNSAFTGSGSGSAHPKKVYFRQLVQDAEMSQDVIKPLMDKKPIINQVITNSDIISRFHFDMSNLDYNDINSAGTMTNDLTLIDPLSLDNDPFVEFTMEDAQKLDVTGGQYVYNPGIGIGTSYGTYTYYDGHFDQYDIDWASYSDSANIVNTIQ